MLKKSHTQRTKVFKIRVLISSFSCHGIAQGFVFDTCPMLFQFIYPISIMNPKAYVLPKYISNQYKIFKN